MQKAKLFQNGHSQAVRLPKAFQCPGKEVYIKRIGHTILLIPIEDPWQEWQDNLSLFSEDFLSDRHQPPMQNREEL